MGKSKGGSRQNGAQDYNHVAAIFSVSIAFFDHVCKHDSVAGSWLSAKANPWLDKSASLKIK
jgi:hypothetical protein